VASGSATRQGTLEFSMLMITVETEAALVTLRLEGRLAGPEARDLVKHWSGTAFKQPHQTMMFDLTGVISVDAVGMEFLAQAHRNGGKLVGGATTRAIIDEIVAGAEIENSRDDTSGAVRDGLPGRADPIFGS
jgi:anti-anti-sigma regulatory factor